MIYLNISYSNLDYQNIFSWKPSSQKKVAVFALAIIIFASFSYFFIKHLFFKAKKLNNEKNKKFESISTPITTKARIYKLAQHTQNLQNKKKDNLKEKKKKTLLQSYPQSPSSALLPYWEKDIRKIPIYENNKEGENEWIQALVFHANIDENSTNSIIDSLLLQKLNHFSGKYKVVKFLLGKILDDLDEKNHIHDKLRPRLMNRLDFIASTYKITKVLARKDAKIYSYTLTPKIF